MTPYMKGLHSKIDGWQYDQDSGGRKMKGKHLQAMLAKHSQILELCREGNEGNEGSATPNGLKGSSKGDSEEPSRVLPVERLHSNV